MSNTGDEVPREGDEVLIFLPDRHLEGQILTATVIAEGDKLHASFQGVGDGGSVEFDSYGTSAEAGGLGKAFVYKTTNVDQLRDRLGARKVALTNIQLTLGPKELAERITELKQRREELYEMLSLCNESSPPKS